jgi:hypothetical protein
MAIAIQRLFDHTILLSSLTQVNTMYCLRNRRGKQANRIQSRKK